MQDISKKNNVKFISLRSLICDKKSKTCEFLVKNSNEEIFRDYGRFSIAGISFLNNKLKEIKILKH